MCPDHCWRCMRPRHFCGTPALMLMPNAQKIWNSGIGRYSQKFRYWPVLVSWRGTERCLWACPVCMAIWNKIIIHIYNKHAFWTFFFLAARPMQCDIETLIMILLTLACVGTDVLDQLQFHRFNFSPTFVDVWRGQVGTVMGSVYHTIGQALKQKIFKIRRYC